MTAAGRWRGLFAGESRLGKRAIWAAIVLSVAVLLGGGGRGFPLFNLCVQLTSLVALGVCPGAAVQFFRQAPRPLAALVVLTMLLPVLQLLPLPPMLWTRLPGRQLVLESLTFIGRQQDWRPLSVAPSLTLLALVGLIPPLAVLVLGWNVPTSQKRWLLSVLTGLAILQLAMGAVQLASGGTVATMYSSRRTAYLYGTFASHNATGMFLVAAFCGLLALSCGRMASRYSLARSLLAGLALGLGVVLTQSRSSIALLLVPTGGLLFRTVRMPVARGGFRRLGLVAAGVVVLAGLGGLALLSNAKVAQVTERFSKLEDMRPGIWSDSLVSAERFWPVGSGMGTFDEVFQVDESLEHVTSKRAGRAHNDYLEISIEAGLIGLALVAGWAGYIGGSLLRRRTQFPAFAFGAAGTFICIAAQSALDYPLRNEALLCVAAVFLCLLQVPAADRKEPPIA